MKKFVLFMLCVIMITVFVAFNYLLWERNANVEDLEKQKAAKSTDADIINKQYESARQLTKELNDAKENMENVTTKNAELQQKIADLEGDLQRRDAFISGIKRYGKFDNLENVVKKWVQYINNKEYQNAYDLMSGEVLSKKGIQSLDDFIYYYTGAIKRIEIVRINFLWGDSENTDKEEMVFMVRLNIKKGNSADKTEFIEGENTVYFKMEYSISRVEWIIKDIKFLQY